MVWTFGAGQQRGLAAAERATGSSCGRRRWKKKKKKLKKIPEKILDARGLETPPPPNETRRQVTCFQSSINPNPQADFFLFFSSRAVSVSSRARVRSRPPRIRSSRSPRAVQICGPCTRPAQRDWIHRSAQSTIRSSRRSCDAWAMISAAQHSRARQGGC